MSLRNALITVAKEYAAASSQPYTDHPLADFIRNDAADFLRSALGPSNQDLFVKGSAGSGRWAAVPWLAIFDPLVTKTATDGFYVVFLFHSKEPRLFLSLNQGATAVDEEFGVNSLKVLQERATLIRSRVSDFAPSLAVSEIKLGSNLPLPLGYESGHALGVGYDVSAMPDNHIIEQDLDNAIKAYRALVYRGGVDERIDSDEDPAEKTLTLEERRRYRLHKRIERNSGASKAAKKHHGFVCQACDLDFEVRYGEIGKGYIEAHHLRPISTLKEGEAILYDVKTDFCVLCANCHRMIHRSGDPSDLAGLRARANSKP